MELKSQKSVIECQLARNIQANEEFIKFKYFNEIFISDIKELQSKNKYLKGLIIPEMGKF